MTMKQKGFKQPLHENNSSVLYKLQESYNYFSKLRKTKDDLLLIHTRNKCVICVPIGFMMCISSIQLIYNDLIVNQDIL